MTLKQRRESAKQWLRELKSRLKCVQCGENHPACLEFHHLDPDKKDASIKRGILDGWGIERLREEVSKCIVLCSNCHRKIHWK